MSRPNRLRVYYFHFFLFRRMLEYLKRSVLQRNYEITPLAIGRMTRKTLLGFITFIIVNYFTYSWYRLKTFKPNE